MCYKMIVMIKQKKRITKHEVSCEASNGDLLIQIAFI